LNSWTPINSSNAPSGRYHHTAQWNHYEMIIWGGESTIYLATGGRYNPSTDFWLATASQGAPTPRTEHTAVWTGSEMIIWGGYADPAVANGAAYCALIGESPAYSAFYQAPVCPRAQCCDSGSMLLSRDSIAGTPEQNQPNTLNGTCPDGASGTYHIDESLDRIIVHSSDANHMQPGALVQVIAEAWCASANDALDLYYTNHVDSINWQFLATYPCASSSNLQSFQHRFQLASNEGLHAIRAIIRKQGSASQCAIGPYNDNDDLILDLCYEPPRAASNPSPANGGQACADPVLSWDAVPGASWYDVYFDGYPVCMNITNTSCPVMQSFGTHSWYVVTTTFCGNVSTGPVWTFMIDTFPPALIGNTLLQSKSSSSVQLDWTDSSDAVSYHVYRCPVPELPFPDNWQMIGEPIQSIYFDPVLSDPNPYYYKITALDACSNEN